MRCESQRGADDIPGLWPKRWRERFPVFRGGADKEKQLLRRNQELGVARVTVEMLMKPSSLQSARLVVNLRKEGREEGRQEGRKEGREEGRKKGRKEGGREEEGKEDEPRDANSESLQIDSS